MLYERWEITVRDGDVLRVKEIVAAKRFFYYS